MPHASICRGLKEQGLSKDSKEMQAAMEQVALAQAEVDRLEDLEWQGLV